MSDKHEESEARTAAFAPGNIPTRSAGPGEASGQLIGRYKLLEELGEGGMGTVWMAQQSEPVKRRVALKIIKLGMDTREVVARFEVERQALALMDHAHIAKVLDAGATDSGRPYFVMELVRGVPITKYCDQAKLKLRERLELFAKVCLAIQHAHQKGIIHRDVKPSNILVSMQDGVPLPKVIDFGIAKATSSELTQQTLYTKLSQVIGTPEYMAPEQAESGGIDIDTRADVYSLGVLLYELLTGTKPFDIKQSATASLEELLRIIREDDPAKPSTRISSLGESASSIAVKRQVDTSILSEGLKGDLDWIVMRALEKDRTRRYETASGFAADITRFLNDEPVDAAPPSASYRLRKLLRRRKKTVVSVALILLLFLAGAVGTGVGWWRTQRANAALDMALKAKAEALEQEAEQRRLAEVNAERAKSAEIQALEEASRASEAEAQTSLRAEELEQVASFQAEQLSGLDVQLMGERLREALLAAAHEDQRVELAANLESLNLTSLALGSLEENLFGPTLAAIDAKFESQPLVQAKLFQTLADTLRQIGLLELARYPQNRALEIRQKALGDEHEHTLVSIHNTGFLLQALGRFSEAEPYHERALLGLRKTLGETHRQTLSALTSMGDLLSAEGKLAQAEPYLREALAGKRSTLGDEHPDTLISINNLGNMLINAGKSSEAEPLLHEALGACRRVLGTNHATTISVSSNLGRLFLERGDFVLAEPYFLEALAGLRRSLGDEHSATLTSINNLGSLLVSAGRFDEAEVFLQEALESGRRTQGSEHPIIMRALINLATMYFSQGKLADAELYGVEALAACRQGLGSEHPDTLRAMNNLGLTLQ